MSNLHTKTYKVHESARERNRREQRRFDLTLDGRYNEFKFKLNGINTEQRRVQRDLERICSGVNNNRNNSMVSTQMSLNPSPVRASIEEEKKLPKRSPRHTRQSEEAEIDTEMLFEYIQKLQHADVIDIDKMGTDKSKEDMGVVNLEMNSDTEKSQSLTNQAKRADKLNNCQIDLRIKQADIQSTDIKLDLGKHQGLLKSTPNMSGTKSEVILDATSADKEESGVYSGLTTRKNDTFQKAPVQQEYDGTKQVNNYTTHGNPENTNSDKQWEQARRARYVRTREKLERDRELSVKEIFDQTKP